MSEQELIRLKQRIESAKSKVSELEGRKKRVLEELKTIGHDSIESAEKHIAVLDRQIERLKKKIASKTSKIEEQFK